MEDVSEKKEADLQALGARIATALGKLPGDVQMQAHSLINASHARTLARLHDPHAPLSPINRQAPHQLSLVSTALDGRRLADLLSGPEVALRAPSALFGPKISPDGEVAWIDKYETLDPRWAESAAVWLENYFNKVTPFPTSPATVQISDTTTIALVGDWGTGNYGNSKPPSLQVMDQVRKLVPDYTIHLGDVYYAGTPDQEQNNFIEYWVSGRMGTFALNSNHEMMDGGHGYFDRVLANPLFRHQNKTSYFALENANWVIIGLDSSYFADWKDMYGPGQLDDAHQLPFLKQKAAAAHAAGKTVMVICHQNGLEYDGTSTNNLWSQVTSQLPAGATTYWYWGHEHLGAVYPAQQNILPRCTGHGGIPWGLATGLQQAQQAGKVTWFEQKPNPSVSYLVMNGFTLLTFNGKALKEQFFDQQGNVSWSSP